MDLDLKRIKDLAKILHQFDLSEVEVRQGDMRIRLRRGALPEEAATAPVAAPAPAVERISAAPKAAAPEEEAGVFYVTSPFVGTFYSASSPEAPLFVQPGQTVAAGHVLCIVEAMKLMNEIEAETAGRVLECLVENGKPVEYGQRLFKMARL